MTAPSPDKIAAAAAKAKAKADAAAKAAADAAAAKAKQVSDDQAWLDAKTANMDDKSKDELYQEIKDHCPGTTETDGKIVLACPLPRKMQNCVDADNFDCPNGRVAGGTGCKLSDAASGALTDDRTGTKIDGKVTSAAEGGSYLSPYVPWGEFAHVDSPKKGPLNPPKLTTGNSSGVTIGTGVDLGQIDDAHQEAYLAALKGRGVSQPTLDTIKPLLGKKKADACAALRAAKANGPIVLPESDVEAIDAQSMSSRVGPMRNAYGSASNSYKADLNRQITAATRAGDAAKVADLNSQLASVPKWGDLSGAKQTIMFDSFYQEGNLNGSAADFTSAVLGNNDADAKAALVAKSASSNPALASRGAAELSFFDGGQ
jgi:hypothetical protein